MNTEKTLFVKDAAGNYILDREAKITLLNILRRDAMTEGELDLLNERADKSGIRVVFTHGRGLPESSVCGQGFKALESLCLSCGLASGCSYWQQYGKHFSKEIAPLRDTI